MDRSLVSDVAGGARDGGRIMGTTQRGFVAHRNQTRPGLLAEQTGQTPNHLTVSRGTDDAMKRRNAKLLLVADRLPCPRPHRTFNEISNPARCSERNLDPARYLMQPLEACVDAAVASGNVRVVVETRERIADLFAELQTQLDARFSAELAAQVLGVPTSLPETYREQAIEQAESDVAESQVMLDPTNVIALERAEDEARQEIRAKQRWLDCLRYLRTQAATMVRSAQVSGAQRSGGIQRW